MSLATGRKNVAVWDERRNSSRVFGVSTEDVRLARAALLRFRTDEPELVRWIEDGHPRLSEADHARRFGETYRPSRAKRSPSHDAL